MQRLLSALTLLACCFPALANALHLQVKVSGVSKELTKSILADLHLQQATQEPKLTAARIRNLYDLADEQISTTLQAKGYYNSKVAADLKQVSGSTPDEDTWVASFVIDPGPATKINQVEVKFTGVGQNNPNLNGLYVTPKLIPGQILTHADYEDTKEQLQAGLNAYGYLQADFVKSVIEVNRQNNTADIKFVLNTGPQYVFGKINFIDAVYPDEFLARFAPFKPGDPYELQKLMDFQSNLESADLYNKIRFDPLTDLDNPTNTVVPIDVRLTPKPKNLFTGGIGYGTDTGVRGNLGWLHRRADTEGHKIVSNVYASRIRTAARVNYIIPGSKPATDKYVIGALGQEEKFDELYSRKAELSASKVIKRGKTESMYGIWYFTETFHILSGQPNQNKKYLLPTAKWIWINSHEKYDFEYGTRLDFQVRGGVRGILTDNSVMQMEANAKQIFLLTERMRLLFRATGGAVASGTFNSLAPSLRFFTGGDDTVRGFAYNSLGPMAVKGDKDSNTGGRYLAILSAEVEHKLYDKLSGVVFFDAGNAALSTNIPLAMGSGVGVRYKTPIGNFRLDVAKPLNWVVNKHWRLHVNFGTDF